MRRARAYARLEQYGQLRLEDWVQPPARSVPTRAKTLADALVLMRKELGDRQKDLATRSGIYTSRVRLIEQGRVRPTEDEVRRLAGALDADPEELVHMRVGFRTIESPRASDRRWNDVDTSAFIRQHPGGAPIPTVAEALGVTERVIELMLARAFEKIREPLRPFAEA